MNQLILVLDPGETTGWVMAEVPKAASEAGQVVTLHWGELRSLNEVVYMITSTCPDTLVYEEYTLRRDVALAQTGSELFPAQVVGVIKYACEDVGISRVVPQSPSEGMQLEDKISIPSLIRSPHARSAYCHLACYLLKRGDFKRRDFA